MDAALVGVLLTSAHARPPVQTKQSKPGAVFILVDKREKATPEINDIFLTHLHVDHYQDLSWLLPFSAWGGRWKKPLRVNGSSGRTPELGTKGMV